MPPCVRRIMGVPLEDCNRGLLCSLPEGHRIGGESGVRQTSSADSRIPDARCASHPPGGAEHPVRIRRRWQTAQEARARAQAGPPIPAVGGGRLRLREDRRDDGHTCLGRVWSSPIGARGEASGSGGSGPEARRSRTRRMSTSVDATVAIPNTMLPLDSKTVSIHKATKAANMVPKAAQLSPTTSPNSWSCASPVAATAPTSAPIATGNATTTGRPQRQDGIELEMRRTGRGERRQTSTSDLFVPDMWQLRCGVTGPAAIRRAAG